MYRDEQARLIRRMGCTSGVSTKRVLPVAWEGWCALGLADCTEAEVAAIAEFFGLEHVGDGHAGGLDLAILAAPVRTISMALV